MGHPSFQRQRQKEMRLLLLIPLLLSGCASYKEQVWTPDGFNWTLSRERKSGDIADYFGFTWNLKP
jgi:hypothetical protein